MILRNQVRSIVRAVRLAVHGEELRLLLKDTECLIIQKAMTIIAYDDKIIVPRQIAQFLMKRRVVEAFPLSSLEKIVHRKELRIFLSNGVLFQIATL